MRKTSKNFKTIKENTMSSNEFELGDTVHIKSQNKTGMYYGEENGKIKVKTPSGMELASKDDIEVVLGDDTIKENSLDSIISDLETRLNESENVENDEVQDFIDDTAGLFLEYEVSKQDVYDSTKGTKPIKHLFREIDDIFNPPTNLWDISGLWDTLDNILSSGNYTEAELAQKVADSLPDETNPLAAKGEIEAQPSLYDSVEENEELEEGKIKNAALAALLGLGMYAGFEATDMDNTPLAQAMEKAAEQGDEYAEKELDKLTLYLDAGDTRMLTKLSNKYLGPIEDRKMNEKRENDLTEKDEDDPCWSGYEQVGTKMKDGDEVPNCVPVSESSRNEDDDYQDYLEYRAEARATGQEVMSYDDWSGKTSARGRADDKYNRAMQSGYDIDDPAFDDFMESSLTEEETLLAAMKDSTVAESAGMTPEEARNALRSTYGYDDLAIARAQLDETTSAGSVAAVSAPIGDTKKRSIYDSEEKGSKDSEFDSAWFYKSVDGEVEGPYKAEKEATEAANNYADWVKQGSELEDGDRRLAKRAFLMKSSVSESKTVSELEKKFRSQLNEAMNVNVSVDPKQPEGRSITVTASEQEADELAGLLSNAGLFSSPGYGEVQFQEPADSPDLMHTQSHDMPMEEEGDYSNSPEEKYQDMEYMLDVVSGGLNRNKTSYDKAEDGDNPMAVVKEEDETAVGTMDEFYSYVLDFYGPNGIYDIGATEEEVKKATEIVKNEVGDDFEGDSVDREKVRDVILDQMRSEEEREEAEKAFRSKEEVDYDKINDMMSDVPDPIQTRADVDDDMDRMRNFNETDEVKRLAGLV